MGSLMAMMPCHSLLSVYLTFAWTYNYCSQDWLSFHA
jgi:hypothetical protein